MSTVSRKDSAFTSAISRGAGSEGAKATEDAPSLDEIAGTKAQEQAASFEKKPPGADAQDAIRTIEKKMQEWHVSDKDARQCVDELRELSPADRALVWEAMGPESRAKLLDNVDDKARSLLIDSLSQAGVLKQMSAPPHPNGTTTSTRLVSADVWGSPPEGPTFVVRNPKMEPALQKAVHEENIARAKDYRARYDDYIKAYKDEVVLPAAKNDDIASIRRAGPPGPLLLPEREPGAPLGAKGQGEVDRADAWRKVADPTQALVDVYGPITRAIHHARGEMMAGELRLGIEVALKVPGVDVGASAEGGQDGDVNTRAKGNVALPGGSAYGASTEGDGVETTVGVGVANIGYKRGADDGVVITSVEANIGVVDVGADLEKGTVKLGVGVSKKMGRFEVTAKATAEFKPFLGADEIGLFRKDDGFFDVPPELSEGKAWHELSEERRQDLAKTFGWSEKEWSALSKRQANLAVPTMVGR